MQALYCCQQCFKLEGECTYKSPVQNIKVINTFLARGTFNRHKDAVGRSRMMTSDAILKAPCDNIILLTSWHLPPGISLNQIMRRGAQ
jgi:hypothetical protein